MTSEAVERVLETLQSVRLRPELSMGELKAVDTFLSGFRYGCRAVGLEPKKEIYYQIFHSRGWDWDGPSYRGFKYNTSLTDKEIVEEILTIEIETWKQSYGVE